MSFAELLTRPSSRHVIVSEQHNVNAIDFVAGMTDPGELIRCGYRPELRRKSGENDAEYMARIAPLVAELPESERVVIVGAGIRRASLDTSTGKVAVMVAGKAPWHKLGVNVADAVSSADAIRLASLDWTVDKLPLRYTDSTGTNREAKGVFGIVRRDTGAMLGNVGNRYMPIQNSEGFEFLDSVLGAFGAKYESAGAIYGGSKVWTLVRLPEQAFNVNGTDEIVPFALFCNPHDGSGVANCFPTSERVVCANTYRVARNDADKGIKIRHTGNVRAKIDDAKRALGLAVEGFDKFQEQAGALASAKLPDVRGYVDSVLDQTYEFTAEQMAQGAAELCKLLGGDPAKEGEIAALERKIARRGEIVTDILERYEGEKCGVDGMRGTAWAGFNAVTEFADHSPLVRYKGSDNSRASRRFESVIAGEADAMKQVAFRDALALAN